MHDEQPRANADSRVDVDIEANRTTLELCFVAVVSLIVIAAFISALSYEFVSARTPIVIMVPLIILIGAQFVRAIKASRIVDVSSVLSTVAKGNSKTFNRAAGLIGWMAFLLALIIVAGHYVGIAIVMFILPNVSLLFEDCLAWPYATNAAGALPRPGISPIVAPIALQRKTSHQCLKAAPIP